MSGDLPPLRQQRWLLERLGELILARGHERFLSSPLREPSSQDFPDPWSPDEDGVRSMLRRLLLYAGLGMHEVRLALKGTTNPVYLEQESGGGALHVAAYFAGFEGRTIHFGYDRAHLHDPETMVGILAHEVTHAYRDHHGLARESSAREESLTDLTTVYLGFGILRTNNAQTPLGTLRAQRSMGTRDKGYLSALEMAFLLAAQVVARGADRQAIAEKLRSSPRRYFLAACKELERHKAALLEQLQLPVEEVSTAKLFNAGNKVVPVRVRPTRAMLAAAVALGIVGLGASRVLPLLVLGAVVGAGALSIGLGWWFVPRYRCSHPDCGRPLRLDALVCGNCGGQVAGALDRLRGGGGRAG